MAGAPEAPGRGEPAPGGAEEPQNAAPGVLEHPVVTRLKSESAAIEEWHQAAILLNAENRSDDCEQVLQAAVEYSSRKSGEAANHSDFSSTALLLVGQLLSRTHSKTCTDDMRDHLLNRAKGLLSQVEAWDKKHGMITSRESFTLLGFHALLRAAFQPDGMREDMERSETFLDHALRIDGSCPQALLGKAIVFTHHNEWGKAVGHLRQVLQRLSPNAPHDGLQLKALNSLRFAMATCFCSLGRFEQTKQALHGAVAADPRDVEALCALAHLEAKEANDGVGKSMEYLDEAVKVNQHHPVVLCQLANHAFYCGLDERSADPPSGTTPASWTLAESLLRRVFAASRSSQVQAEACYQLGRLRHSSGDHTAAHQEYSRCRKMLPEHIACTYALAQTCVKLERLDEATALLEEVREKRGDIPDVLKLLTFVYLSRANKAREAVKCADKLCDKLKDDIDAWAMRAEAYDQLSAQHHDGGKAGEAPQAKVGIEAYEHMAKMLEESRGPGGGAAATIFDASAQMWNNLGTLRGLKGDPNGALEAYNRGMEIVDQRLGNGEIAAVSAPPSSAEEAKDLHVARLTMRFNRAWLAESLGDQPNFAQATQDYMAISEEHNWYADTLLRLGAQWQRLGEVDIAVQRYKDAMKQNPVLAALMEAEAYRNQGEYAKALQSAETAVRCAGEKQFHYAHVYLGNLYYEVGSSSTTRPKDRESNMCKALWNFTRALENKKDSHYAANGIGLVFAHRGKLDFAKRTFQSVMQHKAMSEDPAVYINLGHTYMRSGGEEARKAIALYERAKKLRPSDLTIRLYLAKAHFGLQDFDQCCGVLGDATQIWPDDLLLRYNLAVSLETYGVHLVAEEKATKRVVGINSGMDHMRRAIELLTAAARLYDYVQVMWEGMSESEKTKVAAVNTTPTMVFEQLNNVSLHQEYCADIKEKASEEFATLVKKRAKMDEQMKNIATAKEAMEQEDAERVRTEQFETKERNDEFEEQALNLMKMGNTIELGKNLGSLSNAQVDKKGGKKKETLEDVMTKAEIEARRGEDKKNDKKEKKKDKKEKKKDKKDKKRKREDGEASEDSREDGGSGAEDDKGARSPLPLEDGGATAEPAEGLEDELFGKDSGSEDKPKKEKKDKKDKKAKKEAKKRKKEEKEGARWSK